MTTPTFQELLTSQEARFTNEQLEAWASLGSWQALGSDPAEGVDCFWIKGQPNPAMRGFSDEIASVNGSQNDPKRQTNAALIAASPDLARLVLEKDAEIARLKATMQDIKECWDWWQEDTYDRCSTVVDDAIRQAMKETSDE